MNSRKSKKVRKGRGGKIFAILLSIVIFFALIIFGVVMIGRQVISSQTDNIAAKFLPSSGSSGSSGSSEGSASVTDAVSQMGSATPSAIATKLNENADVIKSQSQGMISSAKATSTDSKVTYTLESSKLNKATVGALLLASGDQVEEVADKVLDSMKKAGVAQPKLQVDLTDDKGNVIKTLNYSA
jgi:predicted PurR-regulated permease PerM